MSTVNRRTIIRIAGAFVAWVIGSGFATGQEVLQFYSSYGYWSYGVIIINAIGFMVLGYLLMRFGFQNKEISQFNHFKFFCGSRLGTFYTWLAMITLLFLMPVLIAGGGATLHEYYGLDSYVGSAMMAALVLAAYLIGFERMINILSSLGPAIIIFSITVGLLTLLIDFRKWPEIPSYQSCLAPYQAAPHWAVSGLLYLGLNFLPGSTYFTELGSTASSEKELKWGTVSGVTVLMLSITVMGTAILLNGDAVAGLDIPVLYLARRISYAFSTVFSVMLVLGCFSSCSIMMWSVCSRFSFKKKAWNKAAAVGVAIFSYLISLFSFGNLISTIYPLIGYVGLIFIACVLYKGLVKK